MTEEVATLRTALERLHRGADQWTPDGVVRAQWVCDLARAALAAAPPAPIADRFVPAVEDVFKRDEFANVGHDGLSWRRAMRVAALTVYALHGNDALPPGFEVTDFEPDRFAAPPAEPADTEWDFSRRDEMGLPGINRRLAAAPPAEPANYDGCTHSFNNEGRCEWCGERAPAVPPAPAEYEQVGWWQTDDDRLHEHDARRYMSLRVDPGHARGRFAPLFIRRAPAVPPAPPEPHTEVETSTWDTKVRCSCGHEAPSRAQMWKHQADALRAGAVPPAPPPDCGRENPDDEPWYDGVS